MSNIKILQTLPSERSIKLNIEGREETYSLKTKPALTSELVLASEKDILQNLSISLLVSNLTNSADLMFLAYNALAGTKSQSKMSGLQKSLLDTSGDCVATIEGFVDQSQEVIESVIKIYKWLFDGKENLAVIELRFCGEIAGQMSNVAQGLSNAFKQLDDKSQAVLEAAIKEETLEYQKREQMQKKLNDLKGEQKKAIGNQQELERQYEAAQRDYVQAEERLRSETNRYNSCPARTASAFSSFFQGKPLSTNSLEAAKEYVQLAYQYKENIAAQHRKSLEDIAVFALQIKNLQINSGNASSAIDILHYAVKSLSQIVVSLNQIAMFWSSIERYCKRLQISELLNYFNDLQEFAKAERIEYYQSDQDFILAVVMNLSNWVALNSVCQQYLQAAEQTYNQVSRNILASPSIQTALQQAPLLAQKLLTSVEKERKILNNI
jgi:ABC-type multidrug transport system fused ATPase/permease subunit